jgi:hypothetical protein
MFIFLGVGFVALSLVFVLMYRYAVSLQMELMLNDAEIHDTITIQLLWFGAAVIGVLSITLAIFLPGPYVPYSGFVFALLGLWFPMMRARRLKTRP